MTNDTLLQFGLEQLFKKPWFNICKFDSLCEIANVRPSSDVRARLQVLHTIDYADMPEDVLKELVHLVLATLSSHGYRQTPRHYLQLVEEKRA